MRHSVIRSPRQFARMPGHVVAVVLLVLSLVIAAPSAHAEAQTAPQLQTSPQSSCPIPGSNQSCLPPGCADTTQAPYCDEALQLHGGDVQRDPIVYLVFWGSKWIKDSSGVISAVQGLFEQLPGTAYNNILSQYPGNNSHDPTDFVHNDVTLGANPWIDTINGLPSTIAESDVVNEVDNALNYNQKNGWRATSNSQVIVFPQQGAKLYASSDVCGAHQQDTQQYHTAYSWIRFASDSAQYCDFGGSVAQSMTATTTHEYAESATDPIPDTGWATQQPTGDQIEIGDKCSDYRGSVDSLMPGSYLLSLLWNPKISYCTNMQGQDFPSPDMTPPFYGVHTVQGSIWTTYTGSCDLGSCQSVLGDPLSEETPITGGRVSYFTGRVCAGGYTIPPNTGFGGNNLTSGGAIFWPGSGASFESHGCIYTIYEQRFYGPLGKLGFPTSNEQTTESIGRLSTFAGTSCASGPWQGTGSAIYWSPSTPASEMQGCIYQRYRQDASLYPLLGFPTSDEIDSSGIAYNTFGATHCTSGIWQGSGSALYWSSATGVSEIQGCIYQRYLQDATLSFLGAPGSDQVNISGGAYNYFPVTSCTVGPWQGNGAALYWSSATSTRELQGCIYQRYLQDSSLSYLGFPTSDNTKIPGGAYSTFAGTTCGVSPYPGVNPGSGSGLFFSSAGTYAVKGCIYLTYISSNFDGLKGGTGGSVANLGYPISDEYPISGGSESESDFQNGRLVWNPSLQTVNYYLPRYCPGLGVSSAR